jgi:hypothetical protein
MPVTWRHFRDTESGPTASRHVRGGDAGRVGARAERPSGEAHMTKGSGDRCHRSPSRGRWPEAGSRKPEAGSRKPEAGSRSVSSGRTTVGRGDGGCRQPHWQGLPDWQPQPQPEPQPHAPKRGRFLISAGWSVSRCCVGSGVVLGVSAMGPSWRPSGWSLVPLPIPCPFPRAHQRRTEAPAPSGQKRSSAPSGRGRIPASRSVMVTDRPPGPRSPGTPRSPAGAEPRPPGVPAGHGPSMPVTGWMSCCSSSACSPVTRNTTRLATATAWSAYRS